MSGVQGRNGLRRLAAIVVVALMSSVILMSGTAGAAPIVLSISPTTAANTAPVGITATGVGFVSGASADLERSGQDNIDGSSVTVSGLGGSSLHATYDITAAAPGVWDLRVTNPDESTSVCTGCLTITAATPTVTGASPSSRGQGATSQNIVITGTNFAHGATASFSGTPITVNSTTFTDTTHVTANITIPGSATVGARNVVVTNTDTKAGTCTGCFTVNAGPTVTSISPTAASNSGSVPITFTGTHFLAGAVPRLQLSGQPDIVGTSVNVSSSTTLVATFNVTDAAPESWDARVTNTDAGSGVCAGCFTIAASAPTVTGPSPSSRGQGATDQDITITGTNFAHGAVATFSASGITVNSTDFVDNTHVTANIDVSSTATIGAGNVTVTNTDAAHGMCTSCFTVNAKPTVTSLVPSSRGQGAANQDITVNGTLFVDLAGVTFSEPGITVNSTTFVDAGHLTANITVASNAKVGATDVTVTNPDAGNGSCSGCFTVNAAPTVSSVSPSSRGQGATNQNISLIGSFVDGAVATFSNAGITVNSSDVVDTTHLTANISVAADATPGAGNITVTNPDAGHGGCTACFTVNATPTVTSAIPSSRGQGATGEDITITGTGFVSTAQASFSGSGITVNTTTFVDSMHLTANIDVASGATVGAGNVTVSNTDGGASGTCTNCFTVNAKPTVASADPDSLGQGATAQDVTLVGTHFLEGSEATFSGSGITVNSTDFVDSEHLTANIDVASDAAVGAGNVTVDNGDGGTPGTCSGCFTVDAGPTVTSVSPAAAANTGPIDDLTITGTQFVDGASAVLERTGQDDIVASSVTFGSATTLHATFDITAAPPGAWDVRVTNPDEGTGACSGCFTITAVAPTVASASPSSRGQGASDEDIILTGTHFAEGAAATFSNPGITVNSTDFVDTSHLTANIDVTSTAATGAGNVTVTNTDTQSGTCTGCFTVNAKPLMSSASPKVLGQGDTQNVTINGTGFQNGAEVTPLDGITINTTTFVSSTKLTINVTVDADAALGSRSVTVTNPDGGAPSTCSACLWVGKVSWFVWYDGTHGTPDNFIIINHGVGSAAARIQIPTPIAGSAVDSTLVIGGGGRWTPTFSGVTGGPVRLVFAGTGTASIRSLWGSGSDVNLEEVVATSASDFATTHYWPWYDGVSTSGRDWIHVSNPGTVSADIVLKIHGTTVASTTVAAGHNWFYSSSSIVGGPVVVTATHPVLAAQRVLWGGINFSQTPSTQTTTDTWFPWYDAVGSSGHNWILVANPGVSDVTATIAIASVGVNTVHVVHPGEVFTPTFPGKIGGPVHVTSTGPVIVSQRVLWNGWSLEEVNGGESPVTQGIFNWYDSVNSRREDVLVANTGGSTTHVTIKIAGVTVFSQDVAAGGIVTPTFANKVNGPVVVTSSVAGSIVTSRRTLWGSRSDFTELLPI